jgi:hypothetical protein
VAEAALADVRDSIGKALEGHMSEDQIKLLLEHILAIEKQANGDFVCKKCGQRQLQRVMIPDAPAVTKALIELSNQAWGRPGEAQSADEEKIHFERVIYMGDDDGEAVE